MSQENRISQPGIMKTRRDGMTGGFIAKLIFSVFYNLVFFGGMLFLPAGTFDWPRAWVFLGILFVATIATMVIVISLTFKENAFAAPVVKHQYRLVPFIW